MVKMERRIISNKYWEPIKVQEGLSKYRKEQAFLKELNVFGSSVLYDYRGNGNNIYLFENKRVCVMNDVHDKFVQTFKPYLAGKEIKYDNLINLCIMVKNAGDDFENVLKRNLPYIDTWTILDTGSTDNTVEIIQKTLKHKRGQLYQEPFINFRDSRNRLLDLAGESCFFTIMLDDTYSLNGNIREFLDFVRGDDVVDSYSITIDDTSIMYASNRILKSSRKLRYVNIIHEIVQTDNNLNVSMPYEYGYISDIISPYMTDRTKLRKMDDIRLLEQERREHPEIPRTYYYLGDSYLNVKDWEKARYWFMERAKFRTTGYAGELQDALYYVAVISHFYMNETWEKCHQMYLDCYNMDPSKPDALYFIGKHYVDQNNLHIAFMYLKQAFEIGNPDIQMSYRKHLYDYHIPKELANLCYEFKEYKLGQKCCEKALTYNSDDNMMSKWLNIFASINKSDEIRTTKRIIPLTKIVCFVCPGGWKEWDGHVYKTNGLGGSETFVVRYGETLAHMGYDVFVFCNCNAPLEYNGVKYEHVSNYIEFITKRDIHVSIINRYPEYIPVTVLNDIDTYIVLHDTLRVDEIIPRHDRLKKVLCISEWQMNNNFLAYFPTFKNRVDVISYGIDVAKYENVEKEKYSFIFPSFPNRGLLQLLEMFPKIVAKYPSAKLDVFCDMENEWVIKYWGESLEKIKVLLGQQTSHVTNHGWVNGDTLRFYWRKAHVWFYPCIFEETCCLTAYEAAASKTLVVSNNLAALKESIGDRGVIIHGDARTSEWQNMALTHLFDTLDTKQEKELVNTNYEWALTKSYNNVVSQFANKYLPRIPPFY